ncbi:hypothetical protein F8237_18815 [Bradyrhizobium betae]|uniref:Uncharacterized protein n=1 Tax=Bradyrhizobium betae TaxID=244734 RepID=A0A5P6P7D1_9BRAD|nr:hypothetical protein F8237_18815 [Bradyrhizobium betae]
MAEEGSDSHFTCAEDFATFSAVMPRLDRGIQYAAAFPHQTGVSGILGRPVPARPRLRRATRVIGRRSFGEDGKPGDDKRQEERAS